MLGGKNSRKRMVLGGLEQQNKVTWPRKLLGEILYYRY